MISLPQPLLAWLPLQARLPTAAPLPHPLLAWSLVPQAETQAAKKAETKERKQVRTDCDSLY